MVRVKLFIQWILLRACLDMNPAHGLPSLPRNRRSPVSSVTCERAKPDTVPCVNKTLLIIKWIFFYSHRATIRSLIILFPVMGFTWIFGILFFGFRTLALEYLFAIFCSLQVWLIKLNNRWKCAVYITGILFFNFLSLFCNAN